MFKKKTKKDKIARELFDNLNNKLETRALDTLHVQDLDNTSLRKQFEAKLRENIKATLKDIRENKKTIASFTLEEKLTLLEKSKMSLDEYLLSILTDSRGEPRSFEVLALLLKTQSEIIERIAAEAPPLDDESNPLMDGQSSNLASKAEPPNVQGFLMPSDTIMQNITNLRHKSKPIEVTPAKSTQVEDEEK